MFACSFGIPLKTFHWSPELLPELWDFRFLSACHARYTGLLHFISTSTSTGYVVLTEMT
jgi:hypothetical protein